MSMIGYDLHPYRNYSELLNPKPSLSGQSGTLSSELPFKKLNDIMKVEMLQDKTADEIKEIWLQYHKQKDVLVATIPTETFTTLTERSKEYPLFILPLPRSQGFEFFLLQFAGNTVHFTPLLCYQVNKIDTNITCFQLKKRFLSIKKFFFFLNFT